MTAAIAYEAPAAAAAGTGLPDRVRELALRFEGTAGEYFRIWVVNLCLTLLSLGVFSAWAKVRKKRYFYSRATLDGTPFQYLGQPVPILKGRIVAVCLALLYYAASRFFTSLLPYVLALGAVLAPWVLVRSAAFNARYTAYRNMTFGFDAGYRDALRALYGWQGALALVLAVIAFATTAEAEAKQAMVYGAVALVFGLTFPWWLRRYKHFLVSRSVFGGRYGDLSATGGQFFRIYLLAGLLFALAGALVAALAGVLAGPLMPAARAEGGMLFAGLMLLAIYAVYVLAYAYMQAGTANLVWNTATLGAVRFESTLRARGLAKLYLSNALGILGSAGFLIPWAVIRTFKYRAEHLRVIAVDDLAGFRGRQEGTVRAAGAEVGEFFDLDVSL